MTLRSRVVGIGSFLPERISTNDDMAKIVETSDAWIVERTGIRVRHFADENTFTSTMAVKAAEEALAMAGMTGDDLDAIVLGTVTPDKTFPATAVYVQAALGMKHGCAFDVVAACSGFLYSLRAADNMIRLGQAKTVLVVGSEKVSSVTDFTDRNTCVLFGDGAGCVVLKAEEEKGETSDRGVLDTLIYSDGTFAPELCSSGGASTNHQVGYVTMNGREVFRHAAVNMADVSLEILEKNGLTLNDVDWLVPHQANIRIIEATAKRLNVSMDRIITTVDRHANTSAASIPLALAEGVKSGRLKEGQLLLLPGMGSGFTWGASLIRL